MQNGATHLHELTLVRIPTRILQANRVVIRKVSSRVNRFPPRKPFINPRVEQVNDGWYQGEDCFDPSGVALAARRAILPAADGSLALKEGAAMPGASSGRTRYKTHDLVRRLEYPKSKHIEGRLTPITVAELITRDQRQKDLIDPDQFWQVEIINSVYTPGADDTLVKFTIKAQLGRVKAIPYRVAAPMAWEYPYAHGQLQESLMDRLITASLYGIQLVWPGYASPQAGPDVYPECDWPTRKPRVCANYVLDVDQCNHGRPAGSIGITPNGEEAFTCREEGCVALPSMPCYFARPSSTLPIGIPSMWPWPQLSPVW